MLYLHYGFRSVLVAEKDILRIVILRQGAIDSLETSKRLQSHIPLLVPHCHLSNEHICAGRTETVAFVVTGTCLRSQRSYAAQIRNDLVPRLIGIHPRKDLYFREHLVVGDIVEIERDIPEETGKRPVVECPQGLGLAKQLIILLFRDYPVGECLLYTLHRKIAALHSEIALGPDRGAETRYGRRDVQAGIKRTRRTVGDVGNAFSSQHILESINGFYRDIAAVHDRLAFGILPEIVVRAGNSGGILLQRAGLYAGQGRNGQCERYESIFHFLLFLIWYGH